LERVPGHPAREPADAALREAFERALSRQARAGDDEDTGLPTSAPDTGLAGLAMAGTSAPPQVPVASQALPTPALPDRGEGPPPTTAMVPASLGAQLAALTVPASPDGAQHWQFSFAQPGSPLSGLVLSAQPHAPWQVQVQMALPAQARERSAMDARLAELRQRLAGRGALVGEIELQDSSALDERFLPPPQR
jgi:hypothetical protein